MKSVGQLSDVFLSLFFFSDFLGAFPLKSVQLKRPFTVQPWINSEENIGNLLMVCPTAL